MKMIILAVMAIVVPHRVFSQDLIDICVDVEGVRHKIGDSYMGPDACNTCKCMETGNACTRKFCDPKKSAEEKSAAEANLCVDNLGNIHEAGEKYTHVDGCNTCDCMDFGGACTKKFCLKVPGVAGKTGCVDASGAVRAAGSTWAPDSCNKCTCGAIGAICTQRFCIEPRHKEDGGVSNVVTEEGDVPCKVNGETKFPGSTWLKPDSCNICTCTGNRGAVECTEKGCRTRVMKLIKTANDGNGAGVSSLSALLAVSIAALFM